MYKSLIARMGGEIAIKGKNRPQFEKMLLENMRYSINDLEGKPKVVRTGGRIEVQLNDADMDEVVDRLRQVMGIQSLSPVLETELDMDKIKETSVQVVKEALSKRQGPVRFKVDARRANKLFPLQSPEIAREVGGYVLPRTEGLKVDVHNPELTLYVEVRETKAYIMCDVIPGPGGMPVGTAGKTLLLLSGGIDSPVAGWMTMKRGAKLECIHFHSFPFTSERAQEKVNDLAKMLAKHGGRVKLHNVYFTEIQKAINKHCPEDYSVTIMRRFMMRIATKLAAKQKCLALVTGESLGQVASQTLESMNVINNVTNIPILRPLVAMDKID
ncbi:MAG: tRNA uracil 4-sulfurtransferase ThiI, partial [Tumebacillaceae bacterium]